MLFWASRFSYCSTTSTLVPNSKNSTREIFLLGSKFNVNHRTKLSFSTNIDDNITIINTFIAVSGLET